MRPENSPSFRALWLTQQLVEDLAQRPYVDPAVLRVASLDLWRQHEAIDREALLDHPFALQVVGGVEVLNADNLESLIAAAHHHALWA